MNPSSSVLTRPAPVGAGWARERLWLGMSNVGLWVVMAAAVALVGPPVHTPWVWLVAYLAIQAPFDVIGGWWLPVRHGRSTVSFGAFALRWARGAAVHGALLVAAVSAAVALGAWGGPVAVWIGAALGMIGLLGLQGPWLWALSGLRTRPIPADHAPIAASAGLDPATVKVVDAGDGSFVGGWVGLPGAETLVIPAAWLDDPEALDVNLRRRAVARLSGQRVRGVVLGWLWNLAGLALGLGIAGAADLSAVLQTVAVVTLWSFVGLLVLPTPSRRGVLRVDRAARQAGTSASALASTLRRADRAQEDEPSRSALVETIFHPVPALSTRLRAIDGEQPATGGAWNAARVALLLGTAVGSPLGRAVHCNVGRVELWGVYPGD